MRYRFLAGALMTTALVAPASVQAESVLTAMPVEATAWVENFNPYNATTRLPSVLDFMFEPLVVFNVLQGGTPEYRLAESYAYADDLMSITFSLRDGVQWSDGEAFDAADVVFTYDLLKTHPELDLNAIWEQIAAVEAVDDRTVRIDYKEVNTGLVYKLVEVYIVPEHVWSTVDDPVTFTNPEPVGSGPLTEITRFTEQEYIQCRNPHYWDDASLSVDCMRFPQIATNDQTLTAAAKGELDWFGSFLPDIERTYVEEDPEHFGYWFPAGSIVHFALNYQTEDPGNNEAFNDVAFRRAFSMAMDRQAMVDIAGYGYPTLNEYPSGLGRAFHSWNNPEVDAEYGQYAHFDPDAAKALLTEAGYVDQDGDGFVETPSGAKISFDIVVPNGWTDWVNTCQLAIEGLTAIGIDAHVATPEVPAWTESLTSGTFDVAINSLWAGVTPHYSFDLGFHSRNLGKTRLAASHYSNPDLDALLDSFYKTADHDAQVGIMNQIQELLGSEQVYIPVFNNPLWYQYNTTRFTGWFNADNPVARPVVYEGVPERLLHLLALEPVATN